MESGEKGRVQGPRRIRGRAPGAEILKTLSIKGFQGTSLLDFPGRVASLVFTGGCNLTCPYCHNGGLVLEPAAYPDYPLDELLADLKTRQGFIDGVVVSGGEPTIDAGLPAFLCRLKELGLQVKLDTNGLLPEVVGGLLEEGLVDYVAVDIKTRPERYGELHSAGEVGTGALRQTVELLRTAEVETEYRTTCMPRLVGAPEIDAIGDLLNGAPLWVLQQYAREHAMCADWHSEDVYTPEQLRGLAGRAADYVTEVQVRGL